MLLDSLQEAYRVLFVGAQKLREEFGDHDKATILEVHGEELADVTEAIASQIDEDTAEPDRMSSVEEEFSNVWQDFLQWQAGEPSSRCEYSYGSKKRLGSLLRNILMECAVGIPLRKDVTDDELIEAAKDAWFARSR